MRVLIVAEYASARFGGEAILPLHYFGKLRSRGIEAQLVVQDRTKEHLQALFPDEHDRIHFVPDTQVHYWMHRLTRPLPSRLGSLTTNVLGYLYTQLIQRRVVRQLVRDHGIDIVHQPVPVSPKQPSLMFDLGAPVVIGPMNGGMNFPPAFQSERSTVEKITLSVGRWVARWMNYLIPGKRKAEVLLVSNPRTGAALPAGLRGPVIELVENGVDLDLWRLPESSVPAPPDTPRFLFMGRLVDWKAVDILLQSFQPVAAQTNAILEIIGEGEMRPSLEALVAQLGLSDRVIFRGWLSQPECATCLQEATALVLPSLYECGGAVVLEAMAMARPVIATNWGGPADYLDETCGILVDPTSRPAFIKGLTAAMLQLIYSPELGTQLGKAGLMRVKQHFSWESKVDRMIEIYKMAMQSSSVPAAEQAKVLSVKY
ncbi:glycosyltransferase family 4 protein [Phormidium tenue FACHB-886]|nr:glycosyltransferase family 4 protein [Phormidium tenue FACHB-886]